MTAVLSKLKCRHVGAIAGDAEVTAAEQIRAAVISRYIFRGVLRTTPFGSFAGVALLDLTGRANEATSRAIVWRSIVRGHVGLLREELLASMGPELLRRLPLRTTPLAHTRFLPEPCLVAPAPSHTE